MYLDPNHRFYERRFLGAHYARRSRLHPDEAAVLARYGGDIRGARILDLGVGGGRTTPFLYELGSDYVGVDYSREMIERCRRRYPAVNFEVLDARDLSSFSAARFDFVLFSNNGIDAVDHQGRLDVLKEVRRVLSDAGLFVFSSHNRNFPIPKPWEMSHLAVNPLRSPLGFGKRVASYPVGIFNYLRHAGRHEARDEYCISIDSAYLYSLIHYRIAVAAQKRQLERAGFEGVEAAGADGRRLSPGESETVGDPWIQYICRPKAIRAE